MIKQHLRNNVTFYLVLILSLMVMSYTENQIVASLHNVSPLFDRCWVR